MKISGGARFQAIFAGSAGNLVEWFDWYTYSTAGLYFAPVFFPTGNRTSQLLQTAAVFAVGFLARPLGAWFMGLYADHVGRKSAMTLSVSLMCAGSLIIAATPGAALIGMAAPVILVLARVLQGLSVGGEYGASATYLSEMAGREHRGLWSSFSYVTLIGGQLTAITVLIVLQHLLSRSAMAQWGWRVPFIIGAALAVVAYWMRRRMQESLAFIPSAPADRARSSVRELARRYPREMAVVLGLSAGGSLMFYIYTTYMQKFLVNTAGFSMDQSAEISAASLVGFMLAQPLFGWLSDQVGRRALMLTAFGAAALVTWPLMNALARTQSAGRAFALIMAALVIQSCYTSVSAVVKAELFPANVRALGVALPYAIANAVFGGTAEYIALWFKDIGFERGLYIYATTVSCVSFLVVIAMKDTRRHSRII